MLDLLQILGQEGNLALSLLLAGSALILVNLLTHGLVDRYQARRRQRDQVARYLKPLLSATADLISRIVEVLITQKASMLQAISQYSPAELGQRIPTLTASGLNRHESTAYRLINFLGLANAFTRETADLPPFAQLDRIEFFLHHKIAVGLRGNLYQRAFLSTELQEELGASYLDCDRRRRAADLSAGRFLAYLKKDRYDADLYRCALELFNLTPPFPNADQIDRSDPVWRHTLVLAHLAVYLIDFYQELGMDPQWEEHRAFFVRLIRQWNADVAKHRYLYEPGDLESDNYLDTFPSRRTSTQSAFHVVPSLFGLRERLARAKKWLALNYRGSRFGRRHHPKRISPWGVRIKVREQLFDVRWTYDLMSVYRAVRAYLEVRLLEM